jgi:hypothetical protein
VPLPEDTCTTLLFCRSPVTFDGALPVPPLARTWYRCPVTGTLTVALPDVRGLLCEPRVHPRVDLPADLVRE